MRGGAHVHLRGVFNWTSTVLSRDFGDLLLKTGRIPCELYTIHRYYVSYILYIGTMCGAAHT
jgi:hypothetical protein